MSINKALKQVMMYEEIGGGKKKNPEPLDTKPVRMPEPRRPGTKTPIGGNVPPPPPPSPIRMPEPRRPVSRDERWPGTRTPIGGNVPPPPPPSPTDGGAQVTPPQGLGENKYLSRVSKNQIIKVLEEEYEKILISETVSNSNNLALEKKQIKEFVNYLQTNENITYADLNEKLKWPGLGKILGKVGKVVFGPIGSAVGTAIDAYNFAKNPKQWWKDFNDDYVRPDPPEGPLWPSKPGESIISETPENLPESMKAFWKQRIENQLNEKRQLGVLKGVGKAFGGFILPGIDDLIGKGIDVYDRHVDDEFVRQTHDRDNPDSPYYDPNRDPFENWPLEVRPTQGSDGVYRLPGDVGGGWVGGNSPSGSGGTRTA